MKLAIGCDHAGFGMKEAIVAECRKSGFNIDDRGTFDMKAVDYPDIGAEVASMVATGAIERGILVCGSGIGMSMVANRFKGVRAALCFSLETAELSRLHNDANVLVLPGRFIPIGQALVMVALWLKTPFEGGRHQQRVDKIESACESRWTGDLG